MSKSDEIAIVLSTSLSFPIRPSPILKTHSENCLFAFMSTTDAPDKSLMLKSVQHQIGELVEKK